MEAISENYRPWVLITIITLVTLEIVWSIRSDRKVYSVKETLSNLGIVAGFIMSKYLFAGYQLAILGAGNKFAFLHLSSGVFTSIVCFVLADFIYYWFHRASHVFKPLWAFHVVHHSGEHMNLTTSYRLNWFSALVSPVFFLPLVLFGFQPQLIVICYALNLLYQFLLHTEAIGKLGFIEGWIDTPSAHRVHHGSNPIYIDKNFGGVFMFWDRIFGTYQSETEKPVYGITKGFISYNPFKLVLHGFTDLWKRTMKYKG